MTALPTFATPQAALDALDTTCRSLAYVGGVTVDLVSWSAQFDVNSATATATIVTSLPRPAAVQSNAVVEIQGGHNDLVGTLFHGRLPRWEAAMQERGDLLTLRPVGWTSLLTYRERFDLVYDGPITIRALFDSLCDRRGVPSYRADPVLDTTGSVEIALGGNPDSRGGKVTIPASQSPLSWLNSAVDLFGYRVYDTPDGTVRLSRVSGIPTTAPVVTFAEGVQVLGATGSYDISGVVNYPDVEGVTYEDRWGASVPIRAFPGTVEASPHVPVNDGVAYLPIRSSHLVTQQLAEFALQVALIDRNAPHQPVRWESVAVPGVGVGDVVAIESETVEVSGSYWLVGLDLTGSRDGALTATWDGWRGSGEAAAPGTNVVVTTIQSAPIHLGNETLAHYADPVPNGTSATWPIEIPDRATAVTVGGLAHGVNSQIVDGVESDLEVSKWQVWLPGSDYDDDSQRPVATGTMPSMPEDLAAHKDYTNLANWSPFAVNLNRLDAGSYVLRLVCGTKSDVDDFEVRDVELRVHGTNEPVVVPQEAG